MNRWSCPACYSHELEVRRRSRIRTTMYYGVPCECGEAFRKTDGKWDLSWWREVKEIMIVDDTGEVSASGTIEWNDDDDIIETDIDASVLVKAFDWCSQCKHLEPDEPPFEEEDDREFVSSESTVHCAACGASVVGAVVVDDSQVELRPSPST